MEIVAFLIALINLYAAIRQERMRTAPTRERQQLEDGYDADVQKFNQALTHGDAKTPTQLFDEERQQGIVRGDLDPRGPDPGWVRGGYAGTDQQ